MRKLYKEFKEHSRSKNWKVPNTGCIFDELVEKFEILLIDREVDITEDVDKKIEQKIKISRNVTIDKYEKTSQIQKIIYFLICFENILIIIEESNLSILQKYFSMNIYPTLLFLSDAQEKFNQIIQIHYKLETDGNKKFVNDCFKCLSIYSRIIFLQIIQESIIKYLLLKSYHVTFSDRIKKYLFEHENISHQINENYCFTLPNTNTTSTSTINLLYDTKNELLFIGKRINQYDDQRLQEREIENLSKIHHPLLPKFYGIFKYSKSYCIAIEYINGCTLFNYIKKGISIEEKMSIIFQLMIIIEYLHFNGYVYRDLKPNNIMIDRNGRVVLIDFDRMIKSNSDLFTMTFSSYAAPEVLEGGYKYESDIYSLGLVIYFILTGKKPDEIQQSKFDHIPEEMKVMKDLCQKCNQEKPENRPSIIKLIREFYIDYYKIFHKDFFDSIIFILSRSPNPRLQFEIGREYYRMKHNSRKAFILFSLSANQKYAKAQHYLGLMHYKGNEYFPKDINIAYQYFSKSINEYQKSKHYLKKIEGNMNSIKINFQELPRYIITEFNRFTKNIPFIKRMYSKFQFFYLPMKKIYSTQKNVSEKLIEKFLFDVFKEFKFVTYQLSEDEYSFEEDQFDFSKKESTAIAVICTENKCFIFESINKYLIVKILQCTAETLIDLTKNDFNTEQREEVDIILSNFLLLLSTNFIFFTQYPIVSFLIRRYFCPTYYFKDPSFFIFNNQNSEMDIKSNLTKLLKHKNNNLNEQEYQSIEKKIMNDITNFEHQHKINDFHKDDFIIIREIESRKKQSNPNSTNYLVFHIDTFFIFMMKEINDIEKFKEEIENSSKYSHRCLTKFYGFVKDDQKEIKGMIYEYMSNGNLQYYIDHTYRITSIYMCNLISRIFQSIEYFQSNSLIHSDLNSENILIDHDFIPYISKFESIHSMSHQIDYISNIHSFCLILKSFYENLGKIECKQNEEIISKIATSIQHIYNLNIKNMKEKQINFEEIRNIISNELYSSYFIENYYGEEDQEKNIQEIIQFLNEILFINHSLSFISICFPFISRFLQQKQELKSFTNYEIINIPKSEKSIEEYKFRSNTSATQVHFESPSSVTCIGISAFESCSSLIQISIPKSVERILGSSFSGCSSLTQIIIPSTVKYIGSLAFYQCHSLVRAFIPSSVEIIGYSTFENCSSLTDLTFEPFIPSIQSSTFQKCISLVEITIPNSVTSIGTSAFADCSSLRDITIPFSVTSIGKLAFSKCSSLTNVTIPSSVTSIRESAFEKCTSLRNITIPSSINSIENKVLFQCTTLKEITIPSSVTSIGNYAFSECSSLTQITIPSSVTEIGMSAFESCSLLAQITLPSSITFIRDSTFKECTSLIQITIPSSVTSIGNYAFSICSSLTQITIPSSVTNIGEGAFCGCSSLMQIEIPSSVTDIGGGAFYGCSSLMQIEIPSSITFLGDSIFNGCTSLTQITIPSSLTEILNNVFTDCSSLTHITIPSFVTLIDMNSFNGCTSLTEITIPSSVIEICDGAFCRCLSLTQVKFENPSSLISIGDYAFNECSSLTTITIPDSVTKIGRNTFAGCSSLGDIKIPPSVSIIDINSSFQEIISLLTNSI